MPCEQPNSNVVLRGPFLPVPVQVNLAEPVGQAVKLFTTGVKSGQMDRPILNDAQLAKLGVSLESVRLGLACKHDPYFSLSVARVNPLAH